jgi:hypothetical protein
VRVPISIHRRGGRKLVLAPDGTNVTTAPVRRHVDNAMVKAIAPAFRWREMLENGTHATIAEIATAEKINETYVGRVLRLTLLAPDIVEDSSVPAPPQTAGTTPPPDFGWTTAGGDEFCWKNGRLYPTTLNQPKKCVKIRSLLRDSG